jgi:hypothetical protein
MPCVNVRDGAASRKFRKFVNEPGAEEAMQDVCRSRASVPQKLTNPVRQQVCQSRVRVTAKLTKRVDARVAAGTLRKRLGVPLAVAAIVAVTFVATPAGHAGAATPRVPVILDADMYTSADDAGAAATLFAGALQGQDNVIAIGVNTPYYRPTVSTVSWKCLAAIAQFYGYPNIPIGSTTPDNGPPPPTNDFVSPCAAFASPKTPAPVPVVALYRKALVSQPDGSVVIVATGYEENIDALLNSPPDSISPLSGQQLVAQKVKELDIMGGGYPSRNGEDNFEGHAGAAGDVAAHWPTKIVYSGYEVGAAVLSGGGVTAIHPANSPIRALMKAYAGNSHSITSFDLIPAYHFLQPGDASLTEVGPGTNAITNTGSNTFTTGTGNEYYLSLTNATSLEKSLNALWDTLPGTTSQTITFTSTASSPTVGGTYQVGVNGGATGNPVTLTIDPTSTSGCTIDASQLVSFTAPSGTCLIDANEPGSTTYAPATAVQSLQVAGIPQVITFTSTPPSKSTVGDSYTVTASGGASPNPVVLSIDKSSTSGCSLGSGGNVSLAAPRGTCVIDANQQGNSTYAAAAQVQQTISVGGDAQTVSFSTTPPPPVRVGNPTYHPAASASSGLSVSIALDPLSHGCAINGGAVTFTAVGKCVLDAVQAGNPTFVPAEAQQSIAVGKGVGLVTVTSRAPKSAQAGDTYRPLARSNTGDVIHVSLGSHSAGCAVVSGLVQFRSVGTCVVALADHGNANYTGSTVTEPITIGKGHVRLQVASTPGTARSGSVVSLSATVSVAYATGSVSFSAHGTVLCAAAVRGGVATCRAHLGLPKGGYKIVASYSGSASFFATQAATTVRLT